MDTFECIKTKFDVRQFGTQEVPHQVKLDVLEAARSTGTGLNTQHWRFILVEDKDKLDKLAEESTSGKWVSGANFAILLLTNAKYKFHLIDAGRALQSMQLTAWSNGVASGLYTGHHEERLRNDFSIPPELDPSAVVGFGYPVRKLNATRKNRLPFYELVYFGKYGNTKEWLTAQ